MWAVSTKFFQWCCSVPCKYSLGGPVVSQCTLGQPVAFQWHSSVHWTSQCTLAQGKGIVYLTVYSRHRSKKYISKLCVTGIRVGISPVTGEFPTQRASNAENVSIWWRHHDVCHWDPFSICGWARSQLMTEDIIYVTYVSSLTDPDLFQP